MDWTRLLKDWAVNYVKHRDVMRRRILKIDEEDDRLIVREKDGSYEVLIRPSLNGIADDIKSGNKCLVVALNSERNMKALVVSWESVKRIPGLTILFVNPNSDVPSYWAIVPKTHAIVADEGSLLQGFRSLSENVKLVNEE